MKKESLLEEAKVLIAQKEYFMGMITLTKFICKNKNHYQALYLRGYAKSKLGFNFYAIEDFDSALKINSSFALAYNGRAYAKNKVWSYQASIKDCLKSIELEKDDYKSFCILGDSYRKLSNFSDAINSFDKCLLIKENYAKGFYGKGKTFSDQNLLIEAERNFKKATELDNTNQKFCFELGKIKEKRIDFSAALKIYNKFLKNKEINVENKLIFKTRGKLLQELKNFNESIKDYSELIKINKNDFGALFNRGINYHNLKKYKKAVLDFSHAIKINKNNSNFYLMRAISNRELGNDFEAFTDFKKSTEIDWRNTDAYYYLSNMYTKNDDKLVFIKEGIRVLELLERNPNWSKNDYISIFNKKDFLIMINKIMGDSNK
tara:strand:- start:6084 stop:7211 length:1128 start_codon:yes stop_codon:yes gene_type:complete